MQSVDVSTFDENNGISKTDEETPAVTKRKRAGKNPRKRMAPIDTAIEISSQAFKSQLENTKDIERRVHFLLTGRKPLSLKLNLKSSSIMQKNLIRMDFTALAF